MDTICEKCHHPIRNHRDGWCQVVDQADAQDGWKCLKYHGRCFVPEHEAATGEAS